MKSARQNWALIAAFILHSIFNLTQFAVITGTPLNHEKSMQLYILNLTGILAGAFLLPLFLPIRELREGRCPSRYNIRLLAAGAFFLPNIIIRLLGQEAWLASPVNSAVMALSNGVVTTLIYGLFFSLLQKNRVFWTGLSISISLFVFHLIMGIGRQLLLPFSFAIAGIALTIAGVLLFVFLYPVSAKPTVSAKPPVSMKPMVPTEPPIPHTVNVRPRQNVPAIPQKNRFNIPLYIYPILAAAVVFLTNRFNDRLFLLVLNHFSLGFKPPVIALILAMPLLGFLSDLSWKRFLRIYMLIGSVSFILAPSLLFFSHSQPLFLILYTLNIIIVRTISAVFPFIIADLFYTAQGGRFHAFLGWLLPVTVNLIYTCSFIPSSPFNFNRLGNANALILLSISAIAFYTLSLKIIFPQGQKAFSFTPALSANELFREHNLSDREIQVAMLLIQEGLSNEELGKSLCISLATVKTHLSQIYKKFGVKNRASFLAKLYG